MAARTHGCFQTQFGRFTSASFLEVWAKRNLRCLDSMEAAVISPYPWVLLCHPSYSGWCRAFANLAIPVRRESVHSRKRFWGN